MKLQIRQMSWYKRRLPIKEPQPVSVQIPELQLVSEHKCAMIVQYDNGDVLTLSGRVEFNDIKKTYSVHGIDPHGHQCMVDVIE